MQGLRRDEADDGTPTKSDATNTNRIVQSICTTFHFCEDLGIGFGDSWVDTALDLFGFAIALGTTIKVCSWDYLEVWVLGHVSVQKLKLAMQHSLLCRICWQ